MNRSLKYFYRDMQTGGARNRDGTRLQVVYGPRSFPKTVTIDVWARECFLLGVEVYEAFPDFPTLEYLPMSADRRRLLNSLFSR